MVKWEKRAKLGSITVRKVAHLYGLDTPKGLQVLYADDVDSFHGVIETNHQGGEPSIGKGNGCKAQVGSTA
jgi:hypothetical protein